MRFSKQTLLLMLASVPLASQADVWCKKPNGVVAVRAACKPKEQPLDLTALRGPAGPQGPQGLPGVAGARGPSGIVSTSAVNAITPLQGLAPTQDGSLSFIGGDNARFRFLMSANDLLSGSMVVNVSYPGAAGSRGLVIPSLCYQKMKFAVVAPNPNPRWVPDGLVTRFNGDPVISGEALNFAPGTIAAPVPVASSVTNLSGTYDVGYCMNFSTNPPNADTLTIMPGLSGWIQKSQSSE